MPQTDELLIGTVEAAEILGVDRATIGRWVRTGELPVVRKLPGRQGAMLFDAGVVRRKAQERLLRRQEMRRTS